MECFCVSHQVGGKEHTRRNWTLPGCLCGRYAGMYVALLAWLIDCSIFDWSIDWLIEWLDLFARRWWWADCMFCHIIFFWLSYLLGRRYHLHLQPRWQRRYIHQCQRVVTGTWQRSLPGAMYQWAHQPRRRPHPRLRRPKRPVATGMTNGTMIQTMIKNKLVMFMMDILFVLGCIEVHDDMFVLSFSLRRRSRAAVAGPAVEQRRPDAGTHWRRPCANTTRSRRWGARPWPRGIRPQSRVTWTASPCLSRYVDASRNGKFPRAFPPSHIISMTSTTTFFLFT